MAPRARAGFRLSALLFIGVAVLGASGPAYAGSLGRLERSHASGGSSSSGGKTSGSKSSGGTSRGRSRGGSFLANLFVNLLFSGLQSAASGSDGDHASDDGESKVDLQNGGVALPMVALEPYALPEGDIYITHEARTKSRWAEVKANGGAATNKSIYSFNLDGSVFIGPITVRGGWQRLHEVGVADVDQLDFARGQLGVNVLTAWGERAELHILGGMAGMNGREWTPAADVEVDARVFPVRPIQIRTSFGASMFPTGSPLLRAQFAPGITLGRIDVGVSVSWLHQQHVIDVVSPGLWLAVRL